MALSEAGKEAVFLSKFLYEVLYNRYVPTLFIDNQAAQKLALNPVFHNRTKHIDIRYHFVRNLVSENQLLLEHKATGEMVADVFTKSLPQISLERFRNSMGLIELK